MVITFHLYVKIDAENVYLNSGGLIILLFAFHYLLLFSDVRKIANRFLKIRTRSS